MTIDLYAIGMLLLRDVFTGLIIGLTITLMAKLGMFPAVLFYVKEPDDN